MQRTKFSSILRRRKVVFGERRVMMAQIGEAVVATTADVFEMGGIEWMKFSPKRATPSPPKPVLIFTPIVPGAYHVMLFCHGFLLHNTFYNDLLAHIVSHGFIVVAPQLSTNWLPFIPGFDDEIKSAGKVVDWLEEGLQPLLPENVKAKLEKVVLAGHSKGGKTAFAVALGYAKINVKFSAVVGIDPVGTTSQCKVSKTYPQILTGVPRSLNLNIPAAVIGTGLGPEKANIFFPPCAPNGENHKDFFSECRPPCAHFVTTDYGHLDMLDDNTHDIIGDVISNCACKKGTGPRDLMRKTLGGLVVAFLRAHLDAQPKDFAAILKDPDLAPARLEDVDYIPA